MAARSALYTVMERAVRKAGRALTRDFGEVLHRGDREAVLAIAERLTPGRSEAEDLRRSAAPARRIECSGAVGRPVRRLDETRAARKPVLRWRPGGSPGAASIGVSMLQSTVITSA